MATDATVAQLQAEVRRFQAIIFTPSWRLRSDAEQQEIHAIYLRAIRRRDAAESMQVNH